MFASDSRIDQSSPIDKDVDRGLARLGALSTVSLLLVLFQTGNVRLTGCWEFVLSLRIPSILMRLLYLAVFKHYVLNIFSQCRLGSALARMEQAGHADATASYHGDLGLTMIGSSEWLSPTAWVRFMQHFIVSTKESLISSSSLVTQSSRVLLFIIPISSKPLAKMVEELHSLALCCMYSYGNRALHGTECSLLNLR